ncbi:MAG: hypothetical protein COA79_13355 [Planctomycetota bacterium]|nr:MAG: hypothetical protein COA79_13355 [Planctomycetota bacterium]
MKRSNHKKFNLIEIICAIVILSFALSTIMITMNNNMVKIRMAEGIIKSVPLAEKKLVEYKMMNWSEIPGTDQGFLAPEQTEALKFEMKSRLENNELGAFVHILLKVTFPSDSAEDGFYVLTTDVSVPSGEIEKMSEIQDLRDNK